MLIRAFNLVPGAGFRREGIDLFGHVVTKVSRDLDMETVTVRTHDGLIFAFDFCDDVTLVGLDANLGMLDNDIRDLDLGVDAKEARPSPEDADDALQDAVVMALSDLGFGPDDEERNQAVAMLHNVLLTVPLEDVETIRLPRM
jgi:hypothetical protein